MKIRTGFVSNSSSSSFVMAIDRNFKLPDRLKVDLMKEYMEYSYDDEEISSNEIVSLALDNLCSQKTIWQEECPACVHALINTINSDEELEEKHSILNIDSGPEDGKYINVLCDGEKEEFINKMKKIISS